ncbi:hypothetical protein Bca4012_044150 [Brassica carinata]
MWPRCKLIGCDDLHRSEALQFFRRWESERGEKDIDSHEGGGSVRSMLSTGDRMRIWEIHHECVLCEGKG